MFLIPVFVAFIDHRNSILAALLSFDLEKVSSELLSLRFFICKMETLKEPTLQSTMGIQ